MEPSWPREFRILFPAAVALPIWSSIAHLLICTLDNGYCAIALFYVLGNWTLAGIRTAIHFYADEQQAPTTYAHTWLAIHVIASVHRVLLSVGTVATMAAPVVQPISMGCFAGLWGVTCSLEGAVLKAGVFHRGDPMARWFSCGQHELDANHFEHFHRQHRN